MTVRIFWAREMKCMCAQSRSQPILLSERVLGNGVWTHVNSKGKIHSTRGSEKGQTHDAASCRTASQTHYQLSYSRPGFWYDLSGKAGINPQTSCSLDWCLPMKPSRQQRERERVGGRGEGEWGGVGGGVVEKIDQRVKRHWLLFNLTAGQWGIPSLSLCPVLN